MLKRSGRRAAATLAMLTLAGGASGCSFSAGMTQAVSKEQAATKISQQLEQQVGQRPDSVTCPTDLSAEEGESIRCELTAGGDTLGVTATVTSVDGSDVEFDIQVDEA